MRNKTQQKKFIKSSDWGKERTIDGRERWWSRTAAQMNFGSRTRSVLGGDDLGGSGVRWSRRCWSATRWCLDVRSELSPMLGYAIEALASFAISLSLFYFLGMEINCRENTSVKYFIGFWGMIYNQRKSFSVWLNFSGQPKHTQWCKIFFGNYLPPKQTQPKEKKKKKLRIMTITIILYQ